MPEFTHPGRVAFHETDAAGIVHFSNYFRYAEEAETAALASLGIFSADTLHHYAFPRVKASAHYNNPLHFGEAYEVLASLERLGKSSLTWRFEVVNEQHSCAVLEVTTARRHAADGSAAPYSEEEKAALRCLIPEPPQRLGGVALGN